MPAQLPAGDLFRFPIRHRQNHRLETIELDSVPKTGVFGIGVHHPPPFVQMPLNLAQIRINPRHHQHLVRPWQVLALLEKVIGGGAGVPHAENQNLGAAQ